MEDTPRISDAEWLVMQLLWRSESLTSSEMIQELTETTDWKPKTIQTLIGRLVKKNIISYKKEGRKHHYYALISEDESIRQESETFLQKIYGGRLKPMLAHFVQNRNLTPEEIEELKRILDERSR